MTRRRRLIIFAKAPIPGEVKTRLCPPLHPAEAARLSEAFLLDEVETFSLLPDIQVSVQFSPRSAGSHFSRLLGDAMVPWISPQSSGDLGDRLRGAFDAACPTWWPVAIMASDIPDVPPELIQQACRALEADETDAVLGPTVDGGYYLVAARQAHPELFRAIPWGTPAVLAATVERAGAVGIRLSLLPLWEDVNDEADLIRLRDRLRQAPPLVAPRTRAVLRSIGWA